MSPPPSSFSRKHATRPTTISLVCSHGSRPRRSSLAPRPRSRAGRRSLSPRSATRSSSRSSCGAARDRSGNERTDVRVRAPRAPIDERDEGAAARPPVRLAERHEIDEPSELNSTAERSSRTSAAFASARNTGVEGGTGPSSRRIPYDGVAPHLAHPLLVYAEMAVSPDPRMREAARELRDKFISEEK